MFSTSPPPPVPSLTTYDHVHSDNIPFTYHTCFRSLPSLLPKTFDALFYCYLPIHSRYCPPVLAPPPAHCCLPQRVVNPIPQ